MFAASLHYCFINSHGVEVSSKDVIINSLVFYGIYAIAAATYSTSGTITPAAFIDIGIMLLGVFFGDYFAMILAYKSHK